MITPNDIVTHLQTYLPAFSDLFSDKLTATATANGTIITVTATAHGLSVGASITVAGGTFENSIASVVDNGDGSLRFTTNFDHDLTEPKAVNDPTALTLGGIDGTWNGEHTIVSVPNRRTFEIDFPTGITVLPVITTAVLIEDRNAGIIGIQEVATVPTADTFTFIVSDVPNFPTGTVQNITVVTGIRVAGAADINRAESFYTEHSTNKAWLFVIMNDVDVSKDRHAENDSIATFTRQNLGKQTILQNFSTVVLLPTDTDSAGFEAQNKAYGDIYRALVSTLFGFFFDDPDTATEYLTVNNGHGVGRYNTAFYSHVYDWQVPMVIDFENGFLLQPHVAFRDIVSTWDLFNDPEAQLLLNVDLDDDPL